LVGFQTLATGRDNNFNLCRMLAAISVLISHAYVLSLGPRTTEPLTNILGMSLGEVAVITFFVISGFFVSQSFDRKRSFTDFWVARILRIYPGLALVLLLTVLLLGPFLTTLSITSYFSDPATFTYLPRNLSLKYLQYDLPSVFQDNPYPIATNGSLWTLFYEVSCYGLVAIVGILGLTARGLYFAVLLVVYSVGYFLLKIVGQAALQHHGMLLHFHELTLPFLIGMAFYRFRNLLPLSGTGCVLGIAAAGAAYTGAGPWFREVFILSWCYLVFAFGFLSFRPLKIYNRLGDYSYGMYIYAFPIEQTVVSGWPGVSALGLMAISFPMTLIFAVLSWHMLERPFLAMRPAVSAWLDTLLANRKSLTRLEADS
jgi:peptidoglycan/LPS O-acetylase OafA/YrhL